MMEGIGFLQLLLSINPLLLSLFNIQDTFHRAAVPARVSHLAGGSLHGPAGRGTYQALPLPQLRPRGRGTLDLSAGPVAPGNRRTRNGSAE